MGRLWRTYAAAGLTDHTAKAIARPFSLNGQEIIITCSIGIALAAMIVLGTGCSRSDRLETPKADPRPRNVVIVLVDALRADALGCYGAAGDPTPSIDRIAGARIGHLAGLVESQAGRLTADTERLLRIAAIERLRREAGGDRRKAGGDRR